MVEWVEGGLAPAPGYCYRHVNDITLTRPILTPI